MLPLDHRLFLWCNAALSGWASTWFFGIVTWLGNGFVLAIMILPGLAWRDRPHFRRHAIAMIASVAATGLLVNVAKALVGRPRPPLWAASAGWSVHVPFGVPEDGSMPSGHAQTAFGAAVYLSLAYPRWAPLWIGSAVLVGVSRVALGVHFPSDVLVGACIGALGSWVAFRWARHRDKIA